MPIKIRKHFVSHNPQVHHLCYLNSERPHPGGKSINDFIVAMNASLHKVGALSSSHFKNPGLPQEIIKDRIKVYVLNILQHQILETKVQ